MVNRFEGPYRFLSNLWECEVVCDNVTYPTVENAYQAAKTLDRARRELMAKCTPRYAKKMGRTAILRPDWEDMRVKVMADLLRQKFAPGSYLAQLLKETGDAYLCYGNNKHDNLWGACWCDKCVYTKHQNVLGELLMRLRSELV